VPSYSCGEGYPFLIKEGKKDFRVLLWIRSWKVTCQQFLILVLTPTAANSTQSIHMVYVPSHLYHMLFELFKVR
jgi:hypothetical protein